MPPIPAPIILSTLLFPLSAMAASADFEIDPNGSTSLIDFQFEVPFSGTLIGDYDPETNPQGTSTRPGLFGGSGNNPIPCDITLELASDPTPTSPTGRLSLDFDELESGLLVVEALEIDLLSGGTSGIAGDLVLLYQTFNTINPTSIYLGGFELPIPLAGAQLLRSELALDGEWSIVAGSGKGGIVFDGFVPVLWTIEFDAGTGTQVQEIPVAIPFTGTISGKPGARSIVFGGTNSNSGSQDLDVPVGPIPVPLPTIPPGDATANLLFSGELTSVGFATNLDLSISATEIEPSLPADLNGDGRVNSADLGLLIASWGPCPGCPADINGDGIVNAADLGLAVSSWTG